MLPFHSFVIRRGQLHTSSLKHTVRLYLPGPRLVDTRRQLLTCLWERLNHFQATELDYIGMECAPVLQIVRKILLHGYALEYQPVLFHKKSQFYTGKAYDPAVRLVHKNKQPPLYPF